MFLAFLVISFYHIEKVHFVWRSFFFGVREVGTYGGWVLHGIHNEPAISMACSMRSSRVSGGL
jgi:hypothetical protein